MQTYVDNYHRWDDDQKNIQWVKTVGKEQKELPVHVVNHYCHTDQALDSFSKWESKLPRTRKLKMWNKKQLKWMEVSWFDSSSSKVGLGLTYAFIKYSHCTPDADPPPWSGGMSHDISARINLDALRSLRETRIQQLEQLSYHLKQGLVLHEVLTTVGLFKPLIHLVQDYAEETHEVEIRSL